MTADDRHPDSCGVTLPPDGQHEAVLRYAGIRGKRTALLQARVRVHQPSGGMQGKVSGMEISYRLILELQDEHYIIMSRYTELSRENIRREADREDWMKGDVARSRGFIDVTGQL